MVSVNRPRLKISGGANWCPKCKDFKPLKDFGIDNTRAHGLQVYCKRCRRGPRAKQYRNEAEVRRYVCATRYVSRGSVPWELREEFDRLTDAGESVIIENSEGQEFEWGEID